MKTLKFEIKINEGIYREKRKDKNSKRWTKIVFFIRERGIAVG